MVDEAELGVKITVRVARVLVEVAVNTVVEKTTDLILVIVNSLSALDDANMDVVMERVLVVLVVVAQGVDMNSLVLSAGAVTVKVTVGLADAELEVDVERTVSSKPVALTVTKIVVRWGSDEASTVSSETGLHISPIVNFAVIKCTLDFVQEV